MATDVVTECEKPSKNMPELLAFVKKELDADAERQAKLQSSGAGELPHESQTGVTLDLGHKNLRALPLEVIALIKDKVERLALSHNPQIVVPTQIAQCERLRYLNIRWNQLVHFPEAVLQLTKLEILDLSKNRITSIPEDIKKLTSLKFLAVSRNRITKLPYALGEMSSLGKLKYDDNPIEFPPPDALKTSSDSSASAFEAEREKDTCQKVKRFLRAAAVKDKLRTVSEEDLSEGNVETPRPPKRSFTAGRFPIKPSVSGIDGMTDAKPDSPSDFPPPIPQRSHARGESSNAPLLKRPGIAPLLTNGNDFTRSQSETVSAPVSLRQRRQGFVPKRRPTGNLDSVDEMATRLYQGLPTNPTHSRATSSISDIDGSLILGNGGTPGDLSPVSQRLDNLHTLSMLPGYRTLKNQNNGLTKGSKRLVLTLCQLERPINDVALTMKDDGVLCRSSLERQLFTAQAQVKELDRLLSRLENGQEHRVKTERDATRAITRIAVHALKSYGAVTAELKRKREKIIARADGIYVRSLLFQIYSAMVEARNICSVLGCSVRDAAAPGATIRVSQAWSSKSVTPTQPKAPTARRMIKPAMLHTMSSNGMRGLPPPPTMPLSAMSSRTNTMTSQSSTLVSSTPNMSRTNTMRSGIDEGEGEEQFDKIFLKLQAACNLAAQALPHCRAELQARKEIAQSVGERIAAHHWSTALSKCDEVITNNKALKKRLEVVKINDPGLRYQRDFWQLCDAFVNSWTEFATEIRELSSHRVDISTIKQVMRNVQRHVKDVSKTIFNSPLYHNALGNRGLEPFMTSELSSPLPSPWKATPLSAALGPAIQATVATPNTISIPREFFQEPVTARAVRGDRNDTPMQPPYMRKY